MITGKSGARISTALLLRVIVALTLFGAALVFLLMRAWYSAEFFDGSPMDGPFQLLNALERVRAGQAPGRDFLLFHGLAATLIHYPIYVMAGHDLLASEFARQLLSPLAWTLAMTLLVRAMSGGGLTTLYVAALFLSLTCVSNTAFSQFPFYTVSMVTEQPGNSLIALRWAYPAICGACLIWAFRTDTLSTPRLAIAGAALGLAPCWSFEQGSFAVTASLALLATCYRAKVKLWSHRLPIVTFCVGALVSALLSFSILTRGHFVEAARFAYLTIPQNQGWYFGAPPNPSLATLGFPLGSEQALQWPRQIALFTVVLYPAALLLLLVTTGLAIALKQRRLVGDELPLGLGFLTWFSLLSGASLAGYLSPTYLVPVVSSLVAGGVGTACALTRGHPRLTLTSETVMAIIALSALAIAWGWQSPSATLDDSTLAAASRGMTISGTQPIGIYRSLPPLIRRIKSVPGATLFSTYRGMLDLATAQPLHGRVDYIIHALGDEERGNFLEDFQQGHFSFVHTARSSFSPYEEWLQDSHWDFYRYLIGHYAVVEQSEFGLLWQQRTQALELQPKSCRTLRPDNQGRWKITSGGHAAFVELTARYVIRNPFDSTPIVGALPRYLMEHRGLSNVLAVSLNPHHTSASWLVRSVSNSPGWIVPQLYSPLPGVTFSVKELLACELAIPSDVNPAFEHLMQEPDGLRSWNLRVASDSDQR